MTAYSYDCANHEGIAVLNSRTYGELKTKLEQEGLSQPEAIINDTLKDGEVYFVDRKPSSFYFLEST